MAGNAVTLTFAGDASKLSKAAAQAKAATDDVTKAVGQSGDAAGRSAAGSKDLVGRLGSLGSAAMGASTAIGDAAGTMQALVDVQQAGERRAMEHARALADVEQANIDAEQAVQDLRQAQRDQNQAFLDAKQATVDAGQAAIDVEQANLDAAVAQREYNKAVKEHGPDSEEARQAAIDLKQAQSDLKQANLDSEQAQEDLKQAQEDGRQSTLDAAQATRDAKDAQLDLTDANRAANPPDMQKWADGLNTYAPLLQGLVGITALVTAAQWAWNVAQLASPTTWIIIAIMALIGVIVLIATKTDWFQKAWSASWGWIKGAASSTWEFIKKIPGWIGTAFEKIAGFISAPFRAAFNFVSDAWNNTVGKLSWSVPSWVPFIGGNTISVPQLPKFHTGGTVPGTPGQEVPILALAGEEVTPPGHGGEPMVLELRSGGSALDDLLLEIMRRAIKVRGGNVQIVLGRP